MDIVCAAATAPRHSPIRARPQRAGADLTPSPSDFDGPADLPKMPAQSVIRLLPAAVEIFTETELGAERLARADPLRLTPFAAEDVPSGFENGGRRCERREQGSVAVGEDDVLPPD